MPTKKEWIENHGKEMMSGQLGQPVQASQMFKIYDYGARQKYCPRPLVTKGYAYAVYNEMGARRLGQCRLGVGRVGTRTTLVWLSTYQSIFVSGNCPPWVRHAYISKRVKDYISDGCTQRSTTRRLASFFNWLLGDTQNKRLKGGEKYRYRTFRQLDTLAEYQAEVLRFLEECERREGACPSLKLEVTNAFRGRRESTTRDVRDAVLEDSIRDTMTLLRLPKPTGFQFVGDLVIQIQFDTLYFQIQCNPHHPTERYSFSLGGPRDEILFASADLLLGIREIWKRLTEVVPEVAQIEVAQRRDALEEARVVFKEAQGEVSEAAALLDDAEAFLAGYRQLITPLLPSQVSH